MRAKLGIILSLAAFAVAYRRVEDYSNIDLLRARLRDLKDPFKNAGRSWSDPGTGTYTRLIASYETFDSELRGIESSVIAGGDALNALDSLRVWAKVREEMNIVAGLYNNFRQRLSNAAGVSFDIGEWVTFARTALGDPNVGISGALDSIVDAIVEENMFVKAYQEGAEQICNLKQSPQQLLYNLYNTITLTEIKGYAMMQFSYDLLRLYNNGTFNEEIERTKSKYHDRTSETLRAVKTAMSFAPRELWRCDPSDHKEDSTYTELKQLFQGYIVNEVDLSPTGSCNQNCGYYNFATVNRCFDNQYCSKQRRCNGKVLNCRYIDSDMWICPSGKTSDRRYEYIQYESGLVYGNSGTCKAATEKVDSWWRWLFWHCSYCMCYCDDRNSNSDRYFSLRDVTSDVDQNRVITGLKLEKVNKIIHLVIQQGELLKRAGINESTVNWKKTDNFTIFDRDVENDRDYHTLAWEKRALDLDDLVSPGDHVLTGVRFRVVGTHLNFEIRVTPFNFTSGKLIKPMEKSTWMSNDNTDVKDPTALDKARTEVKFDKPGVPIAIRAPSLPDSRSNQYLRFTPTDFEKDAAQTTVPFLDVQPVVTIPAFPLSGAGIYHKGRKGSGGFVAPRVITYNFEKHLKADLPPQPSVLSVNEIPSL